MKICKNCKQVIEEGKLFCGSCGGIGIEVEAEESQSQTTTTEKAKDEQTKFKGKKHKLVDLGQWENEFPLNKTLNSSKIPRAMFILKVLGVIVLIGVCVSLLASAINALKKEVVSDGLLPPGNWELVFARPKWEKLVKALFIGSLVLYLLLWVPYVKLYLLISKTMFISKTLRKTKEEGIERETHKDCLERLLKEDEDFGDAYAYLLALDQTKFIKELFYSLVTICGKLVEIICLFILVNALVGDIFVLHPSVSVTSYLTHPALWGMVIPMLVDIFIPSFREMETVEAELERLDIKDAVGEK